MTLLPRILYLFHSLPIPAPKLHINNLQSAIIRFIWGKSSHRLSKQTLFRPRQKGGLGLPNLWWYYQVVQLTQLSTIYSKGPKPNWVGIDKQAIPNFTIDFLNWRPPKSRPPILYPTLSHSIALCDSLHKLNSITPWWHPLSHIFHNSPLGMDIKAFQWWLDKGLYRIGHYFNSNGPLKLSYCITKLEMPPSEKFHFHQISHFLHTLSSQDTLLLAVTPYEQ